MLAFLVQFIEKKKKNKKAVVKSNTENLKDIMDLVKSEKIFAVHWTRIYFDFFFSLKCNLIP